MYVYIHSLRLPYITLFSSISFFILLPITTLPLRIITQNDYHDRQTDKEEIVEISATLHIGNTYPRSLILSSCLLVSLLGSPLLSTATASNSSKLGATKRSFRWYFFRANVSSPSVHEDSGGGRTMGNVRQ